jgi:hypothetical protein
VVEVLVGGRWSWHAGVHLNISVEPSGPASRAGPPGEPDAPTLPGYQARRLDVRAGWTGAGECGGGRVWQGGVMPVATRYPAAEDRCLRQRSSED